MRGAALPAALLCAWGAAAAGGWADCSPQADGHVAPFEGDAPYGKSQFPDKGFFNATWEGKPIYVLYPAQPPPKGGFPVLVFMHGSTAVFEQNRDQLERVVGHGFVVLHPFVVGPTVDHQKAGDLKGRTIVAASNYVISAAQNSSSPLFGLADTSRIAIMGHSMGATGVIMSAAGHAGSPLPMQAKLLITSHPGVCGVGPPPWPDTWLAKDLAKVSAQMPIVFTTAENDEYFNAARELKCFNKAGLTSAAAFVSFTNASCQDDGKFPVPSSGHCCSFKATPEPPFKVTALKLYLHHDGNPASKCYDMLWGSSPDSLRNDPNADTTVIIPPVA